MLRHVTEHLRRVSVNPVQVRKSDGLVQELLPDPGCQVEGDGRLGEEGVSQESTEVLQHHLVAGCRRPRIKNEALTIGTVLVLVVGRADQDWNHAAFQLLCNVGQRFSEETASVNSSFTLEGDGVGLFVG